MKKTMRTNLNIALVKDTTDSNIKFNMNNHLSELWESAEIVVKCVDGSTKTYKIEDLTSENGWLGFDPECGFEVEEEVTEEEENELGLIRL